MPPLAPARPIPPPPPPSHGVDERGRRVANGQHDHNTQDEPHRSNPTPERRRVARVLRASLLSSSSSGKPLRTTTTATPSRPPVWSGANGRRPLALPPPAPPCYPLVSPRPSRFRPACRGRRLRWWWRRRTQDLALTRAGRTGHSGRHVFGRRGQSDVANGAALVSFSDLIERASTGELRARSPLLTSTRLPPPHQGACPSFRRCSRAPPSSPARSLARPLAFPPLSGVVSCEETTVGVA